MIPVEVKTISPQHKCIEGLNKADVQGTMLDTGANKKKVKRNADIKLTTTGFEKSTNDIN